MRQKRGKKEKTTGVRNRAEGVEKENQEKEARIPVKPYAPIAVVRLSEGEFQLNACSYRLVYNYREGFDLEKLAARYSELLFRYDYVVGDWGYEQLRLKGFFQRENQRATREQRIDALMDYLYEFCNFGCAFFVLERIGEAPVVSYEEEDDLKSKKKPRYQKKRPRNQAYIEEKRERSSGKFSSKNQKRKENLTKPLSKKGNEKRKVEKKSSPAPAGKRKFTVRSRGE